MEAEKKHQIIEFAEVLSGKDGPQVRQKTLLRLKELTLRVESALRNLHSHKEMEQLKALQEVLKMAVRIMERVKTTYDFRQKN